MSATLLPLKFGGVVVLHGVRNLEQFHRMAEEFKRLDPTVTVVGLAPGAGIEALDEAQMAKHGWVRA